MIKTLIETIKSLFRLATFRPLKPDAVMSIGLAVENRASENPAATAVVMGEGSISWADLNRLSNQFSDLLQEQGIGKGDSVAVMLANRTEFLAALIGIAKIGAVAGLINTSLTGKSLLHCLQVVNSRKFIFGEEVVVEVEEIKSTLPLSELDYIYVSDRGERESPDWAIDFVSARVQCRTDNPKTTASVLFDSPAYYIFTSGTTGLPKAAIVTHWHWHKASNAFCQLGFQIERSDRIFMCLPLFHTAGMLAGFGVSALSGCSMYLARRFSASNFLEDARKYQTTCFLYIGEICRYLVNLPEQPDDADNPIKKCVGNGLRPDIWRKFKRRFGIERIGEYYGSTEGNAAFINVFNKDYTVGICFSPFVVVKYDVDNDEIVRDERGLCIEVEKGEPGLLLTLINEKYPFRGYTSEAATRKKVVRNVSVIGDRYCNTGDLIKKVDVGFTFGLPHYQFVDRIGDTYRWKGENVSTNEVSEAINHYPGIRISNVYGVMVPETEGRAGMAALVVSENQFEIEAFSSHVLSALPSYARPLFIRKVASLETTATSKLQKGKLREESFDPDKCQDDLYVLKPSEEVYVPLTQNYYQKIQEGTAGF